MKKKIMKILGSIVVVLIAVIITMYFSLNLIVASGIKTIGSKATGTKVEIESVNISLFNGTVEIKGFCVANPQSYHSDNAVALDRFYMDFNLKSIFTDKIVINNVIIDYIRVDYELSVAKGISNLQEINNNITKYFASDKKNEVAAGEKKKSGKKVVIKYFVIKNGTISVSSALINTTIKVPMSKIEMYDIGAEDNKSAGNVIVEVYAKILQSVGSVVSNTHGITEASESLGKSVNESLKSLQSSIGL
jgi:hypothetical protein